MLHQGSAGATGEVAHSGRSGALASEWKQQQQGLGQPVGRGAGRKSRGQLGATMVGLVGQWMGAGQMEAAAAGIELGVGLGLAGGQEQWWRMGASLRARGKAEAVVVGLGLTGRSSGGRLRP